MTFVLHWRRDGSTTRPELIERLTLGLTKLRDDPMKTWSRGPLAVLAFEQPPSISLSEQAASFVAMLSGRLDDFDSLVDRLGGSAVLGGDPSDADVLAAAYERWGEQCFEHLLGDFAAVVWEPSRHSLLCARDLMGMAPFYYWSGPEEIVVAGHLGGVMAHPAVRAIPNEGYIAEILADDIHSRHETLYGDVWRLVAGHAARFADRGAPMIWQWGQLEPLEMPNDLPEANYDEMYRDLLTQSIKDRMRGPGKVGAELSGGLDSSSVAVLAAPLALEKYDEPLHTYSLTFPGLSCDESPYVGAVAQHCCIAATLVPSSPPPPNRCALEPADTLSLPYAPNGEVFLPLLSSAKQDGFVGVLTGLGGDQWFDNYPFLPSYLARRGRLWGAWKAARRLSPDTSAVSAFWHRALRPVAAATTRKVLPRFRPPRVPAWLTPQFAARTNLLDRVKEPDQWLRAPTEDRLLLATSGWEAFVFEANALGEDRVGVERLNPFYDVRLIRFALGLPEDQRWAGGQFRTIQRRALGRALPSAIRQRTTKAEFSHLFLNEFQAAGGSSRFDQLVIAEERDWVRSAEMSRMYDILEDDARTGRVPRYLWPLWQALAVESWYPMAIARSRLTRA